MGEGRRVRTALLGATMLALVAGCTTTTRLTSDPSPDLPTESLHALPDQAGTLPLRPREPVFIWSRKEGPSKPFGPVDAEALGRIVDTDLDSVSFTRPDLALALTLSGPREARKVAGLICRDLDRALTRHDDPADAVVLLGSTVVVRGIRGPKALRSVRRLLSGYDGRLLVEGDRYGEGAIVTDLSCRPTDRARARLVARDLDAFERIPPQFFARPPWVDPPLTRTERAARATYHPFLGRAEHAERRAARVGRRMGQLPITRRRGDFVPAPTNPSEHWAMLTTRLGRRLDVSGFLSLGHFAPSLAALLGYLDRAGCTDVRYRVLDWDSVRGD